MSTFQYWRTAFYAMVVLFFFSFQTVFAAEMLTRSFGRGATDATTGGEVSILQRILAKDRTIYPEGLVTGTFGPATERAVQNWQKKYRIVTSGTPATTGFGWVGAKTRASLNQKAGITPPPAPLAAGTTSTKKPAGIGMLTTNFGLNATDATTDGNVSILQKILAQDKVIYPEGLVTGTFGPATLAALKRYQCRERIICEGTPATTGFGWVGEKTRAALNAYASATMWTTPPSATRPDPAITGALSVEIAPNLSSTYSLTKSAVLTNTIKSSFVGSGNGLKVTFTQTGAPKGITVPATLTCVTPCSVENRVTIAPGLAKGTYPLTVTAVAGTEKAIGTYTVTIGEPEAYSFTITPSGPITVKKSLSGAVTGANELTLRTVSGEPQPVTITQTSGTKLIAVRDLGTCTPPCTKANSISVGYDLVSGTYPVTVNARAADGTTRSATYSVIVNYNEKFGFHISNQEDPDKSITMTKPVAQSVTSYIPLKFILDGGTPSYARVVFPPKLPDGVSASISGCMLPCDATLAVTISPGVIVGAKSVPFTVEADYIDPVDGKQKTLKKGYTQVVHVVLGNMGTVN